VQSTDKNFLVPVGGAVVTSGEGNTAVVDAVGPDIRVHSLNQCHVPTQEPGNLACFGSVPALKSPKIEQNRPKSPKIAPRRARNNYGAYLARNFIQRVHSYIARHVCDSHVVPSLCNSDGIM